MSNTEFVMVPREPTDEMIVAFAEAWYSKRQCIDDPDMLDAYAAMLAASPAEQHQGEPVALPARKDVTADWAIVGGPYRAQGWNACLDEIAKLGPLYTRPAQGEPVAWLHKMHHSLVKTRSCLLFTKESPWSSDAEENPSQRHEVLPLYTRPAPVVQKGEPFAWWCWNPGMGPGDTDSVFVTARHPKEQMASPDAWMKVIADKPLYQHPDPAEVERLRKAVEFYCKLSNEVIGERDELRAQAAQHKLAMDAACAEIAERDALLRDAHEELVCRNSPVGKRIDAALSASAEPRAEVKNMGVLVNREGVGVYYIEQSNPANLAGHSFNKLVVPTGFSVRFETGEIHVSKCADREPVERDDLTEIEAAYRALPHCPDPKWPDNHDSFSNFEWGWQARAAMERKP